MCGLAGPRAFRENTEIGRNARKDFAECVVAFHPAWIGKWSIMIIPFCIQLIAR